jgi:hypothetical protein
MAPILGMSTTIAAGAIISGAYMGDKMSPLSETTILVPSLVGGVTTNEHIKGMLWTVVPSFVIAFMIFLIIGLTADPASTAIGTDQARDALGQAFNISSQPAAARPAHRAHAVASTTLPGHLLRRDIHRRWRRSHSPRSSMRSSTIRAKGGPRWHRGGLQGDGNGFVSSSSSATIDGLFTGGA